MADPTITEGGVAVDPAGNPTDMPRALAHSVSHELFNVLSLLHSARDQIEAIGTEGDTDRDGLTDADSRAASLLWMADDRVRALLKRISPYV